MKTAIASIPLPPALPLGAILGFDRATVRMRLSSGGSEKVTNYLTSIIFRLAFRAEEILTRRVCLSMIHIAISAAMTLILLC